MRCNNMKYSKTTCSLFILFELLEKHTINTDWVCYVLDISKLNLYRYVRDIKNFFVEFNRYEYSILYFRSKNCYCLVVDDS